MKALIAKDTTKLCLIQVPKNVSHPLNSDVDNLKLCLLFQYKLDGEINALDLAHSMRKQERAGRPRHTYKLGENDEKRDTFVTVEVA